MDNAAHVRVDFHYESSKQFEFEHYIFRSCIFKIVLTTFDKEKGCLPEPINLSLPASQYSIKIKIIWRPHMCYGEGGQFGSNF